MRKIKIIIIVISFALSFGAHFAYEIFPNFLTSILFPVNESVWEHMKIIYTCIIASSVIEYFIYKKKNIEYNNFIISIPVISIIGIALYLLLFYFITSFVKENMFISLSLLLITYIICEISSYYILNSKKVKYEKLIGIILIILSYIIFTYLTYNPIKNHVFLDTKTNSYGIK